MTETVGAILFRSGRVLLGLRAPHKTYAGCWDVIGGHVEPGETPWTALQRELVEEIGIRCRDGAHYVTLKFDLGQADTETLHLFIIRSWDGLPRVNNDEHARVEWFTLDDAQRLPNLASKQYQTILASLI